MREPFDLAAAVASLTTMPHEIRDGRTSTLRLWAGCHELNRPEWRDVWTHSWPWLAVLAMMLAAGCWTLTAIPGSALLAILALSCRRPCGPRR